MKLRRFFPVLVLAIALPCLAQPVITSQPDGQTNVVDDATYFFVAATGVQPFTYQWRKSNGSSVADTGDGRISGAKSDFLAISAVRVSDAGTYFVEVRDANNLLRTSSNAALVVLAPPVISTQPATQSKILGSNVTFSIRISSAGPPTQPVTFQWYHDGSALTDTTGVSGSTSTNLTLTNLDETDDGDYYAIVSNPATAMSGNDVLSDIATLTIVIPPTISLFTVDDDLITEEDTTTFTVYADGTDTLTYLWRRNGIQISNGEDNFYTVDGATASDQGSYTVEVSSSAVNAISPVSIRVKSDPIFLTVLIPPSVGSIQPQGRTVSAGTSVTLTASASGTAPFSYQWQLNGNPVDRATNTSYTFIAADTAFAGSYSIVVNNATDQPVESDNAVIVVNAESQRPTVAITFPSEGGRWSNNVITIRGTAADNAEVSAVFWTFNQNMSEGAQQPATGTTNWTVTLPLTTPGTNTFYVRSRDSSGNYSAPVIKRIFVYVLAAPLTLVTNGIGSVTPSLGGQLLEVGKNYTLTAKPGFNQLFSNWTGSVTVSTNPVLTFTMQSNLAITATFFPNPFPPFIPHKGTYSGLFYRTNVDGTANVEHQTSGAFALKLTDKGTFSCKIMMGGGKYSAAGTLNINGMAVVVIPRTGLSSLTLSLLMDVTNQNDRVTGTISDGSFVSALSGDRAVFDGKTVFASQAGKYNLALVNHSADTSVPDGDGVGTVTVTTAGKIALKGSLADGSSIRQKAILSRYGQWPFYANLYSGKGSMLGWLTFTNRGDSSIEGTNSWIKTSAAIGKNYFAGFTNKVAAAGSHYAAPAPGAKVLNISNGEVILSGDGLASPTTNNITFNAINTVTVTSGTNSLGLAITTASGAVKGSFVHPVTHAVTPIKGIILPEQNVLRGFFLTPAQSGGVLLQGQ